MPKLIEMTDGTLCASSYVGVPWLNIKFMPKVEGNTNTLLDIPPDPLCIARYGQGELSTRAHGSMYIIVYVRWNHWLSVDSDRTLSNECPDTLNMLYTVLKAYIIPPAGTRMKR